MRDYSFSDLGQRSTYDSEAFLSLRGVIWISPSNQPWVVAGREQRRRVRPRFAGGMLDTGFLFRTADRSQVQDYWKTIDVEQGGFFQPLSLSTGDSAAQARAGIAGDVLSGTGAMAATSRLEAGADTHFSYASGMAEAATTFQLSPPHRPHRDRQPPLIHSALGHGW